MSLNPRSTASNSSRVGKRPAISPIKKHKNTLKKLLPSQAKYMQNLKQKSSLSPSPNITPSKNAEEQKLVVESYNVELDFQLSQKEDIIIAINTVLENQWSESTLLHNRFHSNEVIKNSNTSDELLFLLRGISMALKAETIKYRRAYLSHGLITINQLYSIYEHQGNTFVDRNLEMRIREGKVRKFIITNASPIILRSPQKFQKGKVTYGFENAEVVVKTESYFQLVDRDIKNLEKSLSEITNTQEKSFKQLQTESLKKFSQFIRSNHTALFINSNEELSNKALSSLVSLGYITLTSNHLNEIESHQYSISYPNCGTFLKLINAGRSWLVKTLSKSSYKEILEEHLFNKWEGTNNVQDTSKMTNFKKPFYGYDLYWILADALGAGVIEVFNTPVGRGWKLTGKL